jgi:hypothetical protein
MPAQLTAAALILCLYGVGDFVRAGPLPSGGNTRAVEQNETERQIPNDRTRIHFMLPYIFGGI